MENASIMAILILISEATAFLIGLILYKKIKKSYWIWFVIYLGFVFFSEAIGRFLEIQKINNQNMYVYLVIPAEFLFFYWLFYKHAIDKEKRFMLIGAVVYLLAFLGEELFFKNNQKYFFTSFSYNVGNAVLLVFIFQYFIKLINSNRILYFYHERLFWVSCGLLLFYLGTFPYYGLNNYLYNNFQALFWKYTYIMYFLNCSMYLLFSASFIWGKEN